MASPFTFVFAKGHEKGRDFDAVDVVSSTLALRFQHVPCGLRHRGCESDGVFPLGTVV